MVTIDMLLPTILRVSFILFGEGPLCIMQVIEIKCGSVAFNCCNLSVVVMCMPWLIEVECQLYLRTQSSVIPYTKYM